MLLLHSVTNVKSPPIMFAHFNPLSNWLVSSSFMRSRTRQAKFSRPILETVPKSSALVLALSSHFDFPRRVFLMVFLLLQRVFSKRICTSKQDIACLPPTIHKSKKEKLEKEVFTEKFLPTTIRIYVFMVKAVNCKLLTVASWQKRYTYINYIATFLCYKK